MNRYRIEIRSFARRRVLGEEKIRRLVQTVLRAQKVRAAEISIAVVGDKRMADFAEKYARRRYRTDVFAFDLSDSPDELVGQIIVNAPLAREQAKRLKTDPAAELAFYIVHGLLHLIGYDDHRKNDAGKMHRQAQKYLRQTGFKNPPPLPEIT